MKKFVMAASLAFAISNCFSQENIYDASTLPDSLLKDAHSVMREETINFEVKDIDFAKLSVHKVITVLDAEAEDKLFFEEESDDFRKLTNAEIKVFDANGKSVNSYKMKEMHSIATGDGLVVDGQVYYFRVAAPSYPMTVEYDYDVKYKGTLFYPNYWIQFPEQSVEHSKYTATVPVDLDLKYKQQQINLQPAINNSSKSKTYVWEVKDLKALPYEEGCASAESSYPAILISPNKFSMDGHKGDLSTWKSFGEWYAELSKGSLNLSDETKSFLKDMVKNATSEKQKIKILYHYLQSNFRYVSIQLGIGGYKPFDANFVDQKKYGDCKALANYMEAMLDAVGIVSYPALINAEYNKQPVDPSFPHNSFNHVILCVPQKGDTTWLECTSNETDPGVLGSFTENRNALLITPSGGVLVPTPKSKACENTFNLATRIKLNDDGSGESESVMTSKGEYKEEVIDLLMNEKKDDQKEFLVRRLGFLQPDEFAIKTDRRADSACTTFNLKIEKVPEFTAGSKMFLNPRIYKLLDGNLPDTKERTKDFYFRYPFIKTDTTIYQLPADYTVENLPSAKSAQFDFGSFNTKYHYDEKANTITSIARVELTQNVIPAAKYAETEKFFNGVMKEFSEKIVVTQK
ncbi:MAG: DUF3857 domain-containing protein [Ginsengibacter sp.]